MGANPFRPSKLAKLTRELAVLKTDFKKLESRNRDFVVTIARLNEEVLRLKAMLECAAAAQEQNKVVGNG